MRFTMVSPYLMISLLLLCFLLPTLSSNSEGDLVTELISLSRNDTEDTIELSDELLSRIMSVSPRRSFFFAVFFYTNQLGKNVRLQRRLNSLRSNFRAVSSSFHQTYGRQCPLERHHLLDYRRDIFFFYMEWEKSAASFSLFGVNAVPQIRIVSPNVDDLRNSVNLDQGDLNSFTKSLPVMIESKIRVSAERSFQDELYSRTTRMKFYTVFILLATIKIVYGSTARLEEELEMPCTLKFASMGSLFTLAINSRWDKSLWLIRPRSSGFSFFIWLFPSGVLYADKNEAVAVMHVAIGLMVAIVTHDLLRLTDEIFRKIVVVFTLLFYLWAVMIMFGLNHLNITEHVFETDV